MTGCGQGPAFDADAILRQMSMAAVIQQTGMMDTPKYEDDDQGPFMSERDAVHIAERVQRWLRAVQGPRAEGGSDAH